MEKAYIIIVHKNPQQVARLIDALNDGSSTFFLHLDLKINLGSFQCQISGTHIHWVNRVDASWGEFGLTAATLSGMNAVKAFPKKFDRIIVLSGQDYPIKSNHAINECLRRSPYSNFIEYYLLPNYVKWIPNGGMYRVNKYFFGIKLHQRYKAKTLNFLALFIPPLRRKIPEGMKPYAGSNWWIIDDYTLHYLLDFVESHPEYVAFHKHTFVADELFFHMILLNTDDERIKASTVNDNKRFILWKQYAPHPEWLDLEHLEDMLASDALFARKFDMAEGDEVLCQIDQHRSGAYA